MPIKVKADIKRKYGLGTRFTLRDIPNFTTGSVLNRVRGDIAMQNWNDFYAARNWGLINAARDISKTIAREFNLLPAEEPIFDDLWTIADDGRKFAKDEATAIENDLDEAYLLAAKLADGQTVNKTTFSRGSADRSDASFVVFSDMHMTSYANKPNFFKDFNYNLYLDVLKYYAGAGFCLVENGDVEECVIYEPTITDAQNRKDQAKGKSGFPITQTDSDWTAFMNTRYAQRERNLNAIIIQFQEYYSYIKANFISRGKYVRIAGNHDTYLNENRERDLRDRIEAELGIAVVDFLRIKRNNQIKYLVMHGHQFDEACMQHGSIPFAKSCGESYSECLAWAFQGPDRAWTTQDTRRWYNGTQFNNTLAVSTPGVYQNGTDGVADLVLGNVNRIKEDSKDFVETVMGHEIAWEYFENSDGFNALTLEVFTGEEMYKMRHMKETDMCTRYASEFLNLHVPPDFSKPIPALVLGHTHEPRKNAINPSNGQTVTHYLNSGSAGRFENLIWCVEILANEDRICSWSAVDGKLKKINWRSEGNLLKHDTVEWITVV
jgi:UDP-2,3-diacylglucosamine pyrophosphatase LpxH